MKKFKKTIKRIYKAIIGSIMIFKDPFPFPEEEKGSETDKERR